MREEHAMYGDWLIRLLLRFNVPCTDTYTYASFPTLEARGRLFNDRSMTEMKFSTGCHKPNVYGGGVPLVDG